MSGSSPKSTSDKANTMWGGRFQKAPSELMQSINASIDFDKRLYREDIAGSKAHCAMLVQQDIITQADGDAIQGGLDAILREIEDGAFVFDAALEDIHMNVEARLRDLIGDAAGRLHTARSRNDQIATDFKLWVRSAIDAVDADLSGLQTALIDRAEEHAATVMPGFTHLQAAQPVTFGHHLMAYVEMIGRDRTRLADCRLRLNECPLGTAALAGTSFPIDRTATATALGFDRPTANSLDSAADRDFALEYLSALTIIATHLSRFAEELVIWSSAQFGFVRLSDAFTTGSSIMPQKKNPDAAELVRGKIGRVLGAHNALVMVMKGLALTYGKDMQEDKEPVFDATDTIVLCIAAMTGMVRDLEADAARLEKAAGEGYATATDLADWLVRVLNMPFRDAHHVTGRVVRLAEEQDLPLEALSLADMQSIEPRIGKEIFDVLGVTKSVESRTSYGGTAPQQVLEQIKRWRASLT